MCRQWNRIQPQKFQFAKEEVEFAGFEMTMDGYKPTPKFIEAIRAFPTPKNLTGIRSWFGLVNQASYAFAQAPLMAPFRELLKHNSRFYWDETLDELFTAVSVATYGRFRPYNISRRPRVLGFPPLQ